jgi:hypothetical protein
VWRGLALVIALIAILLGSAPGSAPAASYSPISFAPAQSIDSTNTIKGVSCPTVSFCVAVDAQGYALVSTTPAVSSSWQSAYLPSGPPLNSVSCPTTTFCVAVDSNGNAFVSTDPGGDSTASWTEYGAGGTALDSVSCPSTSICAAASPADGVLISTNGGSTWSLVAGTAITPDGVSCPSTSLCVAVGNNTQALTLTNLTMGAGAIVTGPDGTADSNGGDQFAAVTCANPSLCVGVDQEGYAAISADPSAASWSAATLTGSSSTALNAVSCPLTSMCVAVDASGAATFTTDPTDGASAGWTSDETGFDGYSLLGVSCPQSGFCVAVDSDGGATIGTGATLDVALAGAGGGTITDSDSYISCGSACSAQYAAGSTVDLTATPGPNSTFVGWSGACSGTGNSCAVTNGVPGSSQTATATFDPPPSDTTITKALVRPKKHTAMFRFTGTYSPTSFQCAFVHTPRPTRKHRHPKTPKAAYATCRSPKTYKNLKPGRDVFYVRAVGPGGTDSTPPSFSFKIS